MVKNLPAMWETWVQSLGWENPLAEGMATHSSILAWRIPMDRGAWWMMVHGVTELDTIEWLTTAHIIRKCHCTDINLMEALLLLLSRFSRVRLCATPLMAAHEAPVPGILEARTLEWVAISFSNAWKWKVKVKSLSCVRLLATPWTSACHAPLPMGFSRQEYWSGLPV